jgi:hypothetical protein
MEHVVFRYSDRDFAAYLMTIGMNFKEIEVTYDKKFGKPKAFVHFEGNKEQLINLHKAYEEQEIAINLHKLSVNKAKINKLIQSEILKLQALKIS